MLIGLQEKKKKKQNKTCKCNCTWKNFAVVSSFGHLVNASWAPDVKDCRNKFLFLSFWQKQIFERILALEKGSRDMETYVWAGAIKTEGEILRWPEFCRKKHWIVREWKQISVNPWTNYLLWRVWSVFVFLSVPKLFGVIWKRSSKVIVFKFREKLLNFTLVYTSSKTMYIRFVAVDYCSTSSNGREVRNLVHKVFITFFAATSGVRCSRDSGIRGFTANRCRNFTEGTANQDGKAVQQNTQSTPRCAYLWAVSRPLPASSFSRPIRSQTLGYAMKTVLRGSFRERSFSKNHPDCFAHQI